MQRPVSEDSQQLRVQRLTRRGDTRGVFMQRGRCTQTLVDAAGSNDWRVRVVAAAHRHAPPPLVRQLGADPDLRVRWTHHRVAATGISRHRVAAVRMVAAASPSAQTPDLRRLINDPDPGVRTAAAANPAAPPAAVAAACADTARDVRAAAATNPAAELPVLAAAVERGSKARQRAVMHPAATTCLIQRAAELGCNVLALTAAARCPPRLLQRLAAKRCFHRPADSNHSCRDYEYAPTVLGAVLAHRNCPPHIRASVNPRDKSNAETLARSENRSARLGALASHTQNSVRVVVAHHPNSPPQALERLSHDPDGSIRSEVARHLNSPPETLRRLAREDPDAVANNHSAPADVLARLATHDRRPVRCYVAANPGSDSETLAVLAADDNTDVRLAAAANPRCGPETLAVLAADVNTDVRLAAAANPHCGLDALDGLLSTPDEAVVAAVAARMLATR